MLAKVVLSALLLVSPGTETAQGVWTANAAFVKDGQIFISMDGATSVQLTRGGAAKSLPLWSKDGSKIALLAGIKSDVALADLMVIATDGALLSNIVVRPEEQNVPSGMRAVEGLEWLSNNRIVVSGSVNPSTVESIVIDIRNGKEINDIYDDGGGAVFSPDGAHVAYITGSPHFTPDEERRPELNVGNQGIYPANGTHVVFPTRPSWSSDGKRLAILSQAYGSNARQLIIWQLGGEIRSYPLPSSVTDKSILYWVDSNLVIGTAEGALVLDLSDGLVRPAARPESNNPLSTARAVVRQLESHIAHFDGKEADFWCADCVLRSLPRSRGPWSPLGN
jgi:WD40-like Beta Propeller Repeat